MTIQDDSFFLTLCKWGKQDWVAFCPKSRKWSLSGATHSLGTCYSVWNGFWKKQVFVQVCYISELLLLAVAGGAAPNTHFPGTLHQRAIDSHLLSLELPSEAPFLSSLTFHWGKHLFFWIRCSEPAGPIHMKQNHSHSRPLTLGAWEALS